MTTKTKRSKMSVNAEINKEYEKIKTEQMVFETTMKAQKIKYADRLLNSSLGSELKNCNSYYSLSIKKKIPFKLRIKRFFNNIFKLFLNNES